MPLDLNGIYIPVPTPFDVAGNLDTEGFAKNIQALSRYDIKGIIIGGWTGEFPYLSKEEGIQLVQIAKKNLTNGKSLIANTGCEGTRMSIDFCKKMSDAGVDGVCLYTPYAYRNRMTPEALFDYYKSIADSSKVPVLLCNNPSRTGIDLDNTIVSKLATHPNVVGLSDISGNLKKMEELIKSTKDKDFKVLAGSAAFMVDAMAIGGSGAVAALANILPNEVIRMRTLVQEGKIDEAKKLQDKISNVNTLITQKYDVPAMKHMMDKVGMCGGLPRRPMCVLKDDEKSIVENEFRAAGFK